MTQIKKMAIQQSDLLVKPNDNLGIIGGGQLGRMLAMEAKRLGIRTIIYSEVDDCPAKSIADNCQKHSRQYQ